MIVSQWSNTGDYNIMSWRHPKACYRRSHKVLSATSSMAKDTSLAQSDVISPYQDTLTFLAAEA